MAALLPPHRQYAVPCISLHQIEWQLARSEARRLVGDDLPGLAYRVGMTPDEILGYLTYRVSRRHQVAHGPRPHAERRRGRPGRTRAADRPHDEEGR